MRFNFKMRENLTLKVEFFLWLKAITFLKFVEGSYFEAHDLPHMPQIPKSLHLTTGMN